MHSFYDHAAPQTYCSLLP